MKIANLAAALAIAVAPEASLARQPVAAPTPARENRAVIARFVDLLYKHKQVRQAYEAYVAPDLIQHNPSMADGREAAITGLSRLMSDPASSFEVKRIVVDGDLAVVHIFGRLGATGPGAAVVEIFRLQGGRIVEHWDVFQPVPGASANGHTMF